MKHIVVCGDSFCSYEIDCKEKHFSQILQEEYGYQVTNIAKSGGSQAMIGFQAQAAIDTFNADVVIQNKTFGNRINVPVAKCQTMYPYNLSAWVYDNPREESYRVFEETFGSVNSFIKGTNMQSLEEDTEDKQLVKAVQLYSTEMQDYFFNEQMVDWILDYWHLKVLAAGKMSLLLLRTNDLGRPLYDFCTNTNHRYSSPFHTDEATQRVVAELIHNQIESA